MGYMQDKRRGGDYHGKHSLCQYSNTDDFLYGHEREDNAHKVPFPRQERGTYYNQHRKDYLNGSAA